jgi:ABC-2 type transport system permease protein
MSSKVLTVARHEFIGTVTRLGYLLTLFGMPVFVGAITLFSGLLAVQSQLESRSQKKAVAIVDESGLFGNARLDLPQPPPDEAQEKVASALPTKGVHGIRQTAMAQGSGPIELRRVASLPAAKDALVRGEVESVVRFPPSYLRDGKVEELMRPPKGFKLEGLSGRLRPWVVRSLLEGRVQPDVAERAARPLRVDTFYVEPDGKTSPEDVLRAVRPFAVPLAFSLLLLLSIFTSASYLATGLAEEKQNRALEMLMTSLTPEQLFWGKLLGIGGAAFLQFFLYLIAVAIPAAFAFAALGLSAGQALAGFVYFVLGFFFFGSCLLAVGAIGNTQKYTQQLSGLFTFTAIVPLMLLTPLVEHPQGTLARVLTYVPFTAPITGMLRAGAGALPWWELIASIAALALGCYVAVKVCARIFRVALLATGTTPSVAQVWRWLRES